jgi:NAD(P) transhydrogenase subunit alpha
MKIAAIKERDPTEKRCAVTPDIAKLFIKQGYQLCVEKNIGYASGFLDKEYKQAGAEVSSVPLEILSDADIILKVSATPVDSKINEVDIAKSGANIIGMLEPFNNKTYFKQAAAKNINCFAMELIPRSSIAQTMDVLSSQSNIIGYRAALEASVAYNKAFPLLMTAAGTIGPAKVLVLGAGVAGLQAIATAKRLGASVSAYDVRSDTKEQIESLGAKFVFPIDHSNSNTTSKDEKGDKEIYAKEQTENAITSQEEFLSGIISAYDIVITTAQIPGKKAPILLTKTMIESMKQESVIVDIAGATGGNTELTEYGHKKYHNGVQIISHMNFASLVAHDCSKLYAKNLFNFIKVLVENGKINLQNEIVKSTLIKI